MIQVVVTKGAATKVSQIVHFLPQGVLVIEGENLMFFHFESTRHSVMESLSQIFKKIDWIKFSLRTQALDLYLALSHITKAQTLNRQGAREER